MNRINGQGDKEARRGRPCAGRESCTRLEQTSCKQLVWHSLIDIRPMLSLSLVAHKLVFIINKMTAQVQFGAGLLTVGLLALVRWLLADAASPVAESTDNNNNNNNKKLLSRRRRCRPIDSIRFISSSSSSSPPSCLRMARLLRNTLQSEPRKRGTQIALGPHQIVSGRRHTRTFGKFLI